MTTPTDPDAFERGTYRFPLETWQTRRDACTDAIAARMRRTATEHGHRPVGGVHVEGREDGDQAVVEALLRIDPHALRPRRADVDRVIADLEAGL